MAYRLKLVRSIDTLRSIAPAWDDLWQRSEVASPLARCDAVADWLESFAPSNAFVAIIVEHRERLVAALPLVTHRPLVAHRRGRWLEIGRQVGNNWGSCGDLLLDPSADAASAMELLVGGLNELPWPLVALEAIPLETARWQAFLAAARRTDLLAGHWLTAFVGQVEIAGSWADYQSRLSGNHRRQMRKAARRARQAGRLALEIQTEIAADELPALVRRGCEIEDRSWKGDAGTSILCTPGMFDWYLRQARRLAEWHQLQLSFLLFDDRPIAFEFGFRAKDTYFSAKVGYDPDHAAFSPGQLLRDLLCQHYFNERQLRLIDFWGPLSEATAKWSTCCYPVGKLLIAPNRPASRWALRGYLALRRAWHIARRPRPAQHLPAVRPLDADSSPDHRQPAQELAANPRTGLVQ